MRRRVLGCRDCARWGTLKSTNFTSQHDHAAPRASTNPHRYQVDFISLIHLRPTFVGPNPSAPTPRQRPEDLRPSCAAVRHRRCPIAVPLPISRPKGVKDRTETVRRKTPLGAEGYVSGLRGWGRLKTRPRSLRSRFTAPEEAAAAKVRRPPPKVSVYVLAQAHINVFRIPLERILVSAATWRASSAGRYVSPTVHG